jgi:hypothetical protein
MYQPVLLQKNLCNNPAAAVLGTISYLVALAIAARRYLLVLYLQFIAAMTTRQGSHLVQDMSSILFLPITRAC